MPEPRRADTPPTARTRRLALLAAALHALVALTALGSRARPAAAQDRTYNAPRWGEERLDWCMRIAAECGQPVALEFCRRKRYEGVGLFRAYRVGRTAATRTMGSNETCSDTEGCTGFAYITCTNPVPRERVFANPAWDGYRLDNCLRWASECGKPAADAFCRQQRLRPQRFTEALHAYVDPEPGYAATRVIGTGQVCEGPHCRGFQQIICR